MQTANKTVVQEFILLGFSNIHKFQKLLFSDVLMAYIICIIGNITIIALVRIETSLQNPMYFFIGVFAVLEIMFVSVTIPKLLSILIQTQRTISVFGCFIQMYFFNALGSVECFLLALMVFDRYLAINNPLQYSVIMNSKFCTQLAVIPWLVGFFTSSFPIIFTIILDFCGKNEVNHFFCDLTPLQNLACSDPFLSIVITSLVAVITTVLPFVFIVGFYILIIRTLLKIRSNEGKRKAFSTCSSHLIVASLFYGTAIIVYVRPKGSQYDKFLALMYTVVTPLLNPFIYTLRNREVKNALRKLVRQLHMKHERL